MKQLDRYLKMKKAEVAFVCAYLEAFEGMAAIRTPQPGIGEDTVLHMMVSPDFLPQFEALISDLKKEITVEEVTP